MTLDDYFRDQISRGQPPMVALHNAAQAYADSLRKRPDCSQYADETAMWDEPEKSLVDEFLGTAEGRRQFAYEKLKYELEGAVELPMSTFVPWHVVVDTSQQDELGNGPQGIAITTNEDDVVDAIAWMQEGTYEDAVVMAKSRETAKALTEAVELLREMLQFCDRLSTGTCQAFDIYGWSYRVRNFLEGKK